MSAFQKQFSLDVRKKEAERIISKYKDRLAIICEKNKFCRDLPEIDRKKYLVPIDLTVGQFSSIIRKRINLSHEMALFLFIIDSTGKVSMPPVSELLSAIYEESKNEDGFLYLLYSSEETFGK